MKSVGGAGLVVFGFLFLYLAVTGRLECFFTFISCLTGTSNPSTGTASASASGGANGTSTLGGLVQLGNTLGTLFSGGSSTTAPTPTASGPTFPFPPGTQLFSIVSPNRV